MPDSPEYIVKRSGQTVKFNAAKIRDAIRKAGNAVSDEEITEEKVLSLTNQVLEKIPPHTIPSVEQVQDIVEEVLIANDLPRTSKAYILYRAERSKLRQTEKDLMDIFKSLTFVDAKDSNIKRENANIDTDTAMGTMHSPNAAQPPSSSLFWIACSFFMASGGFATRAASRFFCISPSITGFCALPSIALTEKS